MTTRRQAMKKLTAHAHTWSYTGQFGTSRGPVSEFTCFDCGGMKREFGNRCEGPGRCAVRVTLTIRRTALDVRTGATVFGPCEDIEVPCGHRAGCLHRGA
jgi:hypothetical protein